MPKTKKTHTTVAQPKTELNPMEALLQKSSLTHIRKGEEIEATIVSLSKKATLFDIGAKAQAVLGEKELKEISTYLPYLKVGEKVKARIISEESKEGFPVVSLRSFFEKGKWEILLKKKEKE